MSKVGRMRILCVMLGAATLGATLAATAGCGVEVGVAYASDGYPPEAYIATAEPVYYGGHASYWYGNRWYYRDGGRWSYYRSEPTVLYQRRIQGPRGHRGVAPVRVHTVAQPRPHAVAPVRVHPVAQPRPHAVVPHQGRPVAPGQAHPAPPPKPRPAAHPRGHGPHDHR